MTIARDVRELYLFEELSLRQIAQRLNISYQTVSDLLESQNIKRRPTGWSRSHVESAFVGWPTNKQVMNARRNRSP